MKKTLRLSAIAGLMLTAGVSSAQDIHFSQFNQSPLTMNPSLAGSTKDIQVILNYKDQWKSVATPYRTYAISGDSRYMKKKWEKGFLGFGLNIFSDKAGDAEMGTTQGNLSIAYHVYVSKNSTMGGGLQAGFGQKSIKYDKLQWGNQYNGTGFDPTLPTGEPVGASSFTYPDFSGGLSWNYGFGQKTLSSNDAFKASAGVAMFHVNEPRQSFYNPKNDRLYSKYVGHAMVEIGIKNTNGVLVPSILYQRQGPSQEIVVGTFIKYLLKEDSKYTGYVKGAAVSLGGFYRAKDAFVVSSLIEVANYAIGISYDVNTSSLKEASSGRGGFELALKYVSPSPFLYQSKARF